MQINRFKNSFSENIFRNKYAQGPNDTWDALADRLVEDVCGSRWGKDKPLMSQEDRDSLAQYIKEMKFVPGGRYLWYAGRGNSYFNNCFLLRAEHDTREEWADLTQRAVSCLMTGGGIGIDYSILRPNGKPLTRTGGLSSGPIPLMQMINEVGRGVMQGGSRRSAIYASLNWLHEDIPAFLTAKNWSTNIRTLKEQDFNFPAPLDMTNISVNYDDKWLYNADRANLHTFVENCRQAMMTGEPGFSFNFGDKQNETLRNACTEVTSEDDSDVCNLGSINLSNIQNIEEFKHIVELGSKFLVCGTLDINGVCATIKSNLIFPKCFFAAETNLPGKVKMVKTFSRLVLVLK